MHPPSLLKNTMIVSSDINNIDFDSISSTQEEVKETLLIITPQRREKLETEVMFRMHFGVQSEIPPNFQKKKQTEHDYE